MDEDRQLVWKETEVVLDGVPVRSWYLALPVLHRGQFNVHWVVQAHGQESWLADAHCPAHALDCDLFDPARELTVLDFAVIVVVAGVDLRNVLDAEFRNDVFRYCRCEHILVLISCCYGDGMPSFAMRTAVCV